ncbi:MAG TPA: FG-GAP-like repeat-containing protein [Iamia sp.]
MTSRPRLRAVVASALLVLTTTAITTGTGSTPVGAATTTLRVVRNVDIQFGTRVRATGTTERYSSPAVADLNGDDKPELVVAAPNGTVTATRLDTGARLWQRGLGATEIHATPIVEDIVGDGKVEVIAATMRGQVVILNGQTGAVIRTFNQGAPQNCPAGVDCRPDGFFATPAVGDVNGDGKKDIIAPSYDHSVYAWSAGGTLLWRAFLYDTLWSSPAIVDIDGNGRNEIVLGGDIYANNPLGVAQGGLVWALNGSNGSRFSGYPKSIPGQVVWSSPAITDLNGDGRWDAVVGTGTNFPDGATSRRVYAFTLSNRVNLPGWPVATTGRVVQQPAVGDIDGDGAKEVVVNTETGYLEAYEANGSRRWATCNANSRTGCGGMTSHSGVVIADVDDDGRQEVIATSGVWLRVFDFGSKVLEAELRLPGTYAQLLHPAAVPSISELNGSTVIVQSAFYKPSGHGGDVVGGDYVRSTVFSTDKPLCAEDWPAFKRSPRRDSVLTARPPWHPFACGRPFVAQQYRDLLGRELDAAGQAYWTARLRTSWSGPRVVEGFMNSAEFRGVAAPVVRLHIGVDSGPPGPASDIRSEMVALRQGETLTEIAETLLSDRPAQTDEQLVDAVFPRLTGRTPSANERAAALDAIEANGQAAWLAALSESFSATSSLEDEVQVAMTYIGLLNRAPDAAGFDFWVDQVEQRGVSPQRLIEQFLASSEYRNRVL